MKWVLLAGLVIGILVVPGAQATLQNITTFNDSVSSKNFTFETSLTNTGYIEIPLKAYVINGTMNFTGNVSYPTVGNESFYFNATHRLFGEGAGLSPNGSIYVGYGLPQVDSNYTFYVLNISGCFDNGWADPSCILKSFLLDIKYSSAQGDIGVSNSYFWVRDTDVGEMFYGYNFDGSRIYSWNGTAAGIDTCTTNGIAYDKNNDALYVMTNQVTCDGKLYVVGDPYTGGSVTNMGSIDILANDARLSIELDYERDKFWGTEGGAVFRANMTGAAEFTTNCFDHVGANDGRCEDYSLGNGIGIAYFGGNYPYLMNESGNGGIGRILFNITDVNLLVGGNSLFYFPDDLDSSLSDTSRFFHESHSGLQYYGWEEKHAILNITGLNYYLDNVCSNDPCDIPITFTSTNYNPLFFNANMAGTIYYSFPFISECDASANISVLNFNLLRESNQTNQTGFLQGSFSSITPGNIENDSFDLNGSDNYTFCIDTTTNDFYLNITLKYGAIDFSDRWYYLFNVPISNSTFLNYSLYLLEEADSTFTTFTVKDPTEILQDNVVVKSLRYFPGNDSYLTVAMGLTGFDGTVVIPLKIYEYYRFVLERDGILITTTSPKMLSSTSQDIYIEPTDLVEFYKFFNNVGYSCDYNNASHIFSCTVSDSSGCLTDISLIVNRMRAFNYSENICTDTGVGPTAALTCDLTGYTNNTLFSYNLEGTFQCSPEVNYSVITGWLDLTSPLIGWGMLGVLMAFSIIITAAFMGLWNPGASLLFSFVGILVAYWIGMIPVAFGSIIALAVSVGILLYKVR